MLIKRKDKKTTLAQGAQQNSQPQGGSTSAAKSNYNTDPLSAIDALLEEHAPSPPTEVKFEWNENTVAQGQAPERRQNKDTRTERRKGWRRADEQQTLRHAEDEAEQLRQNAYTEGYAAGLRQGLEAAQEQLDNLRQQFVDLQSVEARAVATLSEQLIPLAIQVAEKIIHTEVSCDPELIINIASQLLETVDIKQKQIMLKVNPADAERIVAEVESNTMWRMNERQIFVMPNAAIERGSCIVETPVGQVDASFSTQLELVRKLFSLDKNFDEPEVLDPVEALEADDEAHH
jgi:flagellar assembly protein FliH